MRCGIRQPRDRGVGVARLNFGKRDDANRFVIAAIRSTE
jgi:hypothetical protein